VLHPLTPSQVASDQVEMQARREEESSKNSNASKDSKDKTKVEEVSSSKDVAHEVLLTHKTLLHTIHNEQPPFLLHCQAILTCLEYPSLKDIPPSVHALLHEFQDICQRMALMVSHLLEGLSTKLILSQGQVFLIDPPIGKTQLRLRR